MPEGRGKGGRGLFRKLAIAGVGLLALLAIAVVVAPRLIPWDKVRRQIEERGTEALGREVRIRALSVSLLSGVEVSGFRIGAAGGRDEPDLVAAERVVARYRLLPLLWLRVVINRVELVEPRIFVGKDSRGRWSFADLTGKPPAAGGGATAKPLVLPVDVDIDVIEVTGGSLAYRDASVRPSFTAAVDDLDVVLRGFSLSGALASLKAAFMVKVDGKPVPVEAAGKVGFSLNRSRLVTEGLDVELPGVKASVSGEVTELQVRPTMKLSVRASVDLPRVWSGYAAFIPKEVLDGISLAGSFTADVKVSGAAKKLGVEGTASVKGVTVSMKGRPGLFEDLEGSLSFTEDAVSAEGLRFFWLANPFTLSCQVSNLGLADPAGFSYRRFSPRGRFSVACPRLVLDKLMPEPVKVGFGGKDGKDAGGAKEPPPPPEPDFRGMIPNGVDLEGDVRIDEVRARQLVFQKEQAKVRIKGQTITFDFTDASYGAQQSGSGKIVLSVHPVQFEAAGKVAGFQVRPFTDNAVEAFLKGASAAKDRIDGTARAEYAVSCSGITTPSLRKGIKGTALVMVENGKVMKLSFLKAVGKALKSDVFERDMTFTSLGGRFNLGDGKAVTPDFAMDPGSDGDMGLGYKGSIGLVDYALKGGMTTRFNPRNEAEVMKGDVGKMLFVKDKDGWPSADWDVGGTVFLPIVTPSKKQLTKKAKAEGKELLKEKVAPAAKDLLKGLLKKK